MVETKSLSMPSKEAEKARNDDLAWREPLFNTDQVNNQALIDSSMNLAERQLYQSHFDTVETKIAELKEQILPHKTK